MANSIIVNGKTINYLQTSVSSIVYSDGKIAYGVGILDPSASYATAISPVVPTTSTTTTTTTQAPTTTTTSTTSTTTTVAPTTTSTTSTTTTKSLPDYTKTTRYSLAKNLYKINASGFTVGQAVKTIPDLKGNLNLLYNGPAVPVLSGNSPIYKKEGVLFFQNETGIQYSAQYSNSAPYPMEIWMVILKPNYFMFEAFTKGWGTPIYFGELGSATGIRLTNDNDNPHEFPNAIIPVNQFFTARFRLTTIPGNTSYVNVEMWINGVKQTNTVVPQTWYYNLCYLAIGADTNNEYCGFAEYFVTPVLADSDAAKIQSEINTEYNIGVTIPLPLADNIQIIGTNGKSTASYTFVNPLGFPEDVSKRQIRWIQWGSSGVTNATYITANDGQITVPQYSGGRVEIIVYDTQGNYYSIPASKSF